ncbi:uncharacterized protein EAE97_007415 [Botrytis byssoidea]|uniref:Uncharacterized protein n=1 Tax=Botrytis byssoidea TaxID=139641 RepID=A0A9P5ILS3_9HELO|nr:uncharacterized protein EAE97_007415 [Botrytis byssoidea]KAF7939335.1 hypothetical protein EAE97_007415 [Botrytis byssoidea]
MCGGLKLNRRTSTFPRFKTSFTHRASEILPADSAEVLVTIWIRVHRGENDQCLYIDFDSQLGPLCVNFSTAETTGTACTVLPACVGATVCVFVFSLLCGA